VDRRVRAGLREATQRWHPDTDAAHAELRRRVADAQHRSARTRGGNGARFGGALTAVVGVATMSIGIAVIPQVLPGTGRTVAVQDGAVPASRSSGTGNWCCDGDEASLSDNPRPAEPCLVREAIVNAAGRTGTVEKRPTTVQPAIDKAWDAEARLGCVTRHQEVSGHRGP
jgi:hypothetical protein